MIHLMPRPPLRVVKIARSKTTGAHMEIAGEDVDIFRADVEVGRVTSARIELAEQDGVTSLPFQGKELNPSARNRQRLPAALRRGLQEAQTGHCRSLRRSWFIGDPLEDPGAEIRRRRNRRSGEDEQTGRPLQLPHQALQLGLVAQLRFELAMFGFLNYAQLKLREGLQAYV